LSLCTRCALKAGGLGGAPPRSRRARHRSAWPVGGQWGRSPRMRGAAARAWLATPEAHPRPEGRPVPSPRRYLRRVQPAGSRTEMVQGVQPCAGGPTSGDGTAPDNQRSLLRPLPAGVRSAPRWRKTQAAFPAPLPCGACGRRGCSRCGLLFVTREIEEHGARQVLRVRVWRVWACVSRGLSPPAIRGRGPGV
jgi:hypothetical protein